MGQRFTFLLLDAIVAGLLLAFFLTKIWLHYRYLLQRKLFNRPVNFHRIYQPIWIQRNREEPAVQTINQLVVSIYFLFACLIGLLLVTW